MFRYAVLLASLMFVAALAPGIYGQEEEEKFSPVTLPLGPDTDRFYISVPIQQGAENRCRDAIRDMHGLGSDNSYKLFATNNPDDPCRSNSEPAYNSGRPDMSTLLQPTGNSHPVFVIPVTESLLLDASGSITGKLTIEADRISAFQPSVRLFETTLDAEGEEVLNEVANWSAAALDTKTDGASSPTDGKNRHSWDFDLGVAPETLTGKVRVSLDLTRGASGVKAFSTIGYKIITWGEGASYIDIPITSAAGGEEAQPDLITCPDGSEVENGTDCPDVVEEETGEDNNTTDEDPGTTPVDTGNNTTAEQDDNNTASTGEKKGLPGFGLVAVLVAGFIGAAVVRRRDLQVRR
ncbi:MAG: hypothetical protein KY455_10855 [Euryarchaeota archaeon]|nr:hypothetical protein [Euryarchaeota archaeon]